MKLDCSLVIFMGNFTNLGSLSLSTKYRNYLTNLINFILIDHSCKNKILYYLAAMSHLIVNLPAVISSLRSLKSAENEGAFASINNRN